jgi:hypothetical protein
MSMKPKTLTYLNVSVIGYFLLLWILSSLEVKAWIVSFLTELFTIPFMIAIPILLILGGKVLLSGKRPAGLVISFVGLAVLAGLILTSILG